MNLTIIILELHLRMSLIKKPFLFWNLKFPC